MIAIFFGLGTHSTSANAAETLSMKPSDTGSVYYDTGNIYTMYGTKHGAAWSDSTAAMAVSPNDGSAQKLVFCIEPGVPFLSSNNPNYEAVGVNGIPVDAQIASVVWNSDYAFGANWSNADRITAQAVIWELLPQYGIKVDSISGIPDFQAKKQTQSLAEPAAVEALFPKDADKGVATVSTVSAFDNPPEVYLLSSDDKEVKALVWIDYSVSFAEGESQKGTILYKVQFNQMTEKFESVQNLGTVNTP